MIDHDVIERYVDQLLEVNGIPKGTEEQLRLLLSHLYTAVSMFQLLDADSKERVSGFMKILNYNFGAKLVLKERKRNKEKEKTPLHPSIKEKENKEKDEKKYIYAERKKSTSLDERKMAFLLDCEQYYERYGKQLVDDFFCYWSEENKKDGKMLFEYEKTWNTAKRIYMWVNNPISCAKQAALIRLEKTKQGKKKQPAVEERTIVAQRDESNEQLFQAIEESKRKAISHEEYLSQKNSRDENEG